MLTFSQVQQISSRLAMEIEGMLLNGRSDYDLSEEIVCIVYRTDVYETEDIVRISRHIDIEYMFGDYTEINENTPLFQFIVEVCRLPLLEEEQEIVIYKSGE